MTAPRAISMKSSKKRRTERPAIKETGNIRSLPRATNSAVRAGPGVGQCRTESTLKAARRFFNLSRGVWSRAVSVARAAWAALIVPWLLDDDMEMMVWKGRLP